MLEAIKGKTKVSESKTNIMFYISEYVIAPVKSGLAGFAAFFSILILTKALGHLLGTQPTFEIVLDDVFLSSIGFILVFLIRLLENIKEKD